MHAARRDIPILHITADNQNYALTTGQASATTPLGAKTKSTPEGNTLPPLHPVHLVETAGCSFVKLVIDKDIKTLKDTIMEALQHKGFSHINVQQACPSWKRWQFEIKISSLSLDFHWIIDISDSGFEFIQQITTTTDLSDYEIQRSQFVILKDNEIVIIF